MKVALYLAILLLSAMGISAEKPNIIVIYTDDHGWPDIGAAGVYDDLKTPHIDALAASGARATNGYSTAPQCVPSRAGLLSGRAQSRFGVEANGGSMEGFNAQTTIAERLKKAGYATGQIGKWHLGPNPQIIDHGFDDVYSKNANRPCHANFTLEGKTTPMQLDKDKNYHLDACSKAALAFIKRHADEPFFIYLAYRAPHVPLDAPKEYLDRFPGKMPERRRQALAMISAMDDGVAEIVADLKKRGLSENTLIFYIGDNGAPLKIHKHDAPGGGPGWDGSLNEPMNGEKGMLSEGGIRVPYLISWPGTIPPDQVFNHPVTTLDVAATAVEIAGEKTDEKLDGVNLIPFLIGKKSGPPHEFLTWRWIAQAAIREGNWKLLVGGDRVYLYDLASDPGEKINVIAENPSVTKRLRGLLGVWAEELVPPGLVTGKMSVIWEKYFDFYLDGKAAEPLNTKPEKDIQSWKARNADIKIHEGNLRVVPSPAAKAAAPFLVQGGITLDGNFTVTIQLRTGIDGSVGVAWRTSDEKDFHPKHKVSAAITKSPEFQEIEIQAPAKGKTIHLRILLSNGVVDVKKITFEDKSGPQNWNFKN